ncbi:MAG: inositol monophosphatase family protein [Proteobacteria bacterium]|nr:MAG: inositol monophosphatase family protein [Pseudomonadota bacterium]
MSDLSYACNLVEEAACEYLAPADVAADRNETHKDDGSVVTRTDAAIQSFVEERLLERFPSVPFIGEEMSHARQVAVMCGDAPRFWVLDPLDGTTNFVAGFPFYGISLALVGVGGPELGVVHDPVRGETFCAARGKGAWLNGKPLVPHTVPNLSRCVANVDYKRLTRSVAERLVRSPPYRSQRNLGSCVLEWCWLAAGRFQLYLHGGQRLWDYAAGSLILEEAGGVARSFEGKPLHGGGPGKRSVIAAASPELQSQWSAWIFRQGCLSGVSGIAR